MSSHEIDYSSADETVGDETEVEEVVPPTPQETRKWQLPRYLQESLVEPPKKYSS